MRVGKMRSGSRLHDERALPLAASSDEPRADVARSPSRRLHVPFEEWGGSVGAGTQNAPRCVQICNRGCSPTPVPYILPPLRGSPPREVAEGRSGVIGDFETASLFLPP